MERGAKKEGGSEKEEAWGVGNGRDFFGRSRAEIPRTSRPLSLPRRLGNLLPPPPSPPLCVSSSANAEMVTSGTYRAQNIPWQLLAWLEFVSNLNKCLLNHGLTFSWNAWPWNIHCISINMKVQDNHSPSESVWFCPVC